jgi:hypothetical protein
MTAANTLFRKLNKSLRVLRKAQASNERSFEKYQSDPVAYAREVLKVTLTPDQQDIIKHLLIPPCKVLVPSGHDVGKSFLGAVAACFWYDCFNPGVVISTAPTERDVIDVLWTEIRLLRMRAGLNTRWAGAKAAEIFDTPDHYAKGYTARRGESFSGRHRNRMLFIFDEATGIPGIYFDTLRTMFDPALGHAALALFNPISTDAHVYLEDKFEDERDQEAQQWHRFRLSALNHPNVLAELRGEKAPILGAVSLRMINEWIDLWCEPADVDLLATDIEWPPASGKWYRPGPNFQSRCCGLWPSLGDNIWSDALWAACESKEPIYPSTDELPQIGCDTAMGKGEDFHAIHLRWGAVSHHHETSNSMDAVRICERIRTVAQMGAELMTKNRPPQMKPIDPKQIFIKIDDDGTGNACVAILSREGYNIRGIGAGTVASKQDRYPRKRDELWFQTADRAKVGGVSVKMLDKKTRLRIRKQLMAPCWDVDPRGRRHVEPKDLTKEKIGRSPDDADAFNLAYLDVISGVPMLVEPEIKKNEKVEPKHFAKGRWA